MDNLQDVQDSEISRILDFWFHGPCKGKHYWAGGPEQQVELDKLICSEFGALVVQAATGGPRMIEEWSQTADGSLALIILLDQMSRNIYRNTSQAFEQDLLAQRVCLSGIEGN